MKKLLVVFAALAAFAGYADGQEIGPNTYKMREIQYDLQGNSMIPRLTEFPGPGIKCIRLLDGDKKASTGPSCAVLGSSFTVDSNYVINVPVTTGAQGPAGPQGAPGKDGKDGAQGIQGIQGLTGATGAAGRDGVDGAPGAPGATGPAGTTTWSGITGRPTTLSGFGITDAVSSASLASALSGYATTSSLSAYATTSSLSGYATTSALSSGLSQKYNQPTGTTSQYVRGDGSLATFPATVSRVKSSVTKAIGACFQLSATRDAWVTYNVEINSTMNLAGGQKGSLYLETFTDSACTNGAEEVMHSTSGNTAGLNVTLVNTVTQTLNVNGYIMAGLYAKLRTTSDTGAPTFAAQKGQEVLQ